MAAIFAIEYHSRSSKCRTRYICRKYYNLDHKLWWIFASYASYNMFALLMFALFFRQESMLDIIAISINSLEGYIFKSNMVWSFYQLTPTKVQSRNFYRKFQLSIEDAGTKEFIIILWLGNKFWDMDNFWSSLLLVFMKSLPLQMVN